VDVYTLLAIPFFMLAGEFMNRAGLVKDILLFANALIGRVRGGLAYVNVVGSMLFAGISGLPSPTPPPPDPLKCP
jgi:TRAP-type C4-dicarboxylate transport system permease large subunit